MDSFPPELQYLEPSKTRESDASLRQILVESLLLLTTTYKSRCFLRKFGTYRILQKMHLSESSEAVSEVIEKVVDMLQRDESEELIKDVGGLSVENGIEEVGISDDEDDTCGKAGNIISSFLEE